MAVCKACEEPLLLQFEDDDEDGLTEVPDDLELGCGCHFHWECLFEKASEVSLSLKCPSCNIPLATNAAGPSTTNRFREASQGAAILTKYTNEGGVQEDLDILPRLTEEAYLETLPDETRAREVLAREFHRMCSKGQVEEMIGLLRDASDASDEIEDLGLVIRYQDPLDEMRSGLQLAIENSQEQTFWLLLWLCSTLPVEAFPSPVRQAAEANEIGRLTVTPDQDIRSLRDNGGRTASDLAREVGGNPWANVLEAGILP